MPVTYPATGYRAVRSSFTLAYAPPVGLPINDSQLDGLKCGIVSLRTLGISKK